MLTIDNATNLSIDHERLESIASVLTTRDIDLTICDNSTIQTYNHEYRNINKSTDVLSFPLEGNFEHMPLGAIIISADYAWSMSEELRHSVEDEFILLFIHGLLHLLGYDHECDNGEMRAKEEALIKQFNLPKSLIIRTENS